MRPTTKIWAAAIAATLALGGCGGQSGSDDPSESAAGAPPSSESAPTPTTEEWIDAALAQCEAVNEATAAVEPEGDPFGPNATDEDREKGVQSLRAFADSLAAFAQTMRAEGTPAESPDETEAFLSAVETSAAQFDAAAAAAEEDFAGAQPAVGQAFNGLGALEAAAAKVGIGDLESCEREGEPAEEVADGATEVAVTPVGEDGTYDFKIADVKAGKTAFVMENTDDEPHFMFVVRLGRKGDLAKALELEQKGDSDGAQKLAEDVAESDTAGPGETAIANADLEAGAYGMLCFISGPDGAPHAFNGMAVEFAVR